MEKKSTLIFLLCMIALLGSFFYATTDSVYEDLMIDMPFPIVVACFFLAGIVFFGLLSFLPHIIYGLALGSQKNAAILLYFFPIAIATYAGVRLGFLLMDDFRQRKHFLGEFQNIIIMFGIAMILAMIIEVSLPTIITMWPQDMWGLEIKEGKNIGSLISDLAKFIRT